MRLHSPNSKSFNRLENILIIGNGGRENSLAWAIQKNELVNKVSVTLRINSHKFVFLRLWGLDE